MESIKNFLAKSMSYILVFVVGFGIGAYMYYDHYKPELDETKQELKLIRLKYDSAINEKEEAKIKLALEEQKKNAEVGLNSKNTISCTYTAKNNQYDPDVVVNEPKQCINIAYNGKVERLPMKQTKVTTKNANGTLAITQEALIVLDVTDIVNREIANYVLNTDNKIIELKHDVKVRERQIKQHTFWASIAGAAVGALVDHVK